MTGYIQIKLQDFIEEYGEDRVRNILSDFCCHNEDVSHFIQNKAIEFNRQRWSATHLVFASYRQKPVFVGYFTLAQKSFQVNRNAKMSKTMKKRILNFAQYNPELKQYFVAAPLIAQLGKNYFEGRNNLITGDELLQMACDEIGNIQSIIGGKLVYLECEDKPRLVEFYESNGFYNFGKRTLDSEETGHLSGKYLIQMLKYLK